MSGGASRRRGLRFDADLLVRVVGLDDGPKKRRANISASGIYLELEGYQGAKGAMELLELSTADDAEGVEALATVVRTKRVRDVWRGRSAVGVAFRFLANAPDVQQRIRDLVKEVAQANLSRPVSSLGLVAIDHRFVAAGDVGIDEAPAAPAPEQVPPEFSSEEDLAGAIDSLLDNLVGPLDGLEEEAAAGEPGREPVRRLQGRIEERSVLDVLGEVEQRTLTGRLHVRRPDVEIVVWVEYGQAIDAQISGSSPPARQVLEEVLGWREGEYEFVSAPVDRRDQIGMTMSALLLGLSARKLDRPTFEE